jgi:hypothetical protein
MSQPGVLPGLFTSRELFAFPPLSQNRFDAIPSIPPAGSHVPNKNRPRNRKVSRGAPAANSSITAPVTVSSWIGGVTRVKMSVLCPAIKKLRQRLDRAAKDIRSRREGLIHHYLSMYGLQEAFGVQFIDDDDDIFELIAGRFGDDKYTNEYMDALLGLCSKVHHAAIRHRTVWCWEEELALAVELKRLTHLSPPNLVCDKIPRPLMKLHRDDNAVSLILYWIEWRSGGGAGPIDLRDPLIINSRKKEWPFACKKDCCLLDIMGLVENFVLVDQISLEFLSILLTIKMRHIAVPRIRALLASQFLDTKLSDFLLPETCSIVLSFLTGGEKAREIYEDQLEQANRLMDYIDSINPNILLAFLNPELLVSQADPDEDGAVEMEMDVEFEDIKDFYLSCGDEKPVVKTLISVLIEREGGE